MEQEQVDSLTTEPVVDSAEESASQKKARAKRERGPQIAFDLSMAVAPFALATVLVTIVGLSSAFISSGSVGWVAELCASFRTQCVILLLICTIPSVLSKPWRIMALICGVLALVSLLLVSPVVDMNKAAPAKESYLSFSLLEAVLDKSTTMDEVVRVSLETNPELLTITGVTLDDMARLNEKLQSYHIRALYPNNNGHGVCVYSKVPLKNSKVLYLGKEKLPVAVTSAFFEYGWVNIVAFKAPEVADADSMDRRNDLMESVSNVVSSLNGPVIVSGNMNLTPYAGNSAKLVSKAKLKVLRSGLSIKPNSYAGPQDFIVNRLPVDDIYVNDKVSYLDRSVISGFEGRLLPIKGVFSLSNKDEKYQAPKFAEELTRPPKKQSKAPAPEPEAKTPEPTQEKEQPKPAKKSRKKKH